MTVKRRSLVVSALTLMIMLVASPAFAHVTVRTDDPAPEAYSKYTVRVPNESEDAATTTIEVELPEGFEEARYQPLEGWDIDVTDGVLTIAGGRIEPGEFQEFAFSTQNPAETGDLTFPAIQTYDDGEEARWAGEPDSDQPAPVVAIEGEAGGHGGDHGDDDAAAGDGATEEEAATSASASSVTGSSSSALSMAALVAGLLGLALGGAAFARSGRRPQGRVA